MAAPPLRDNLTLAVGPRLLLKVRDVSFRPGIAIGTGVDDPMRTNGYRIVQFDLPIIF